LDLATVRYHSGMRRLVVIVAAALAAAVTGVAAPVAAAHVPFLEPARSSDAPAVAGDPFPGAVPLPDAAISRAVYGTLAPGEQFDAYRVTVSRAARTPLEMLVPKAARYREFRPAFALVGPGLQSSGTAPAFITARLHAPAGAASGSTAGVVVVPDPGTTPRPTFYEPFSFTSYYRGGSAVVDLQPGRTYFLVVYDPAGDTGEYALGVGEAESFTPADWFRSIAAVVRIKLGLYGQGAFHPLAAVVMAAAVAAVVGVIVWRVRRRRRRRAALRGRATAAGP
jgi:hypothetical protein